jgi:hypothetical protein
MPQQKTFIVEIVVEEYEPDPQLPSAQEVANLLDICANEDGPSSYIFTTIRVYDSAQHYQLGQPDGIVELNP